MANITVQVLTQNEPISCLGSGRRNWINCWTKTMGRGWTFSKHMDNDKIINQILFEIVRYLHKQLKLSNQFFYMNYVEFWKNKLRKWKKNISTNLYFIHENESKRYIAEYTLCGVRVSSDMRNVHWLHETHLQWCSMNGYLANTNTFYHLI